MRWPFYDFFRLTLTEKLFNALSELKLDGIRQALMLQIENSNIYSTVSFEKGFEELLNAQLCYESNRKYNSLIKAAKLKTKIEFNDLTYTAGDGISQEDLMYLSSNIWALNVFSNIFIQGPCGSGKTALCCAIG